MSNIRLSNSGLCLDFLGDYEVKSVELTKGTEMNGNAIMRVRIGNEEYELRVSLKEGKKEGIGLMVREDGTLFMRMMFVNDECEGEVTKKNRFGRTVLKGRVSRGVEVGLWIEYDDNGKEVWRGLYRNGKRYLSLREFEGMKGWYSELNMNSGLLSVSEYDENWMKNGRCFEVEEGYVKRECVYENGMKKRVLREWNDKGMIEYDVNGKRVYEGGYVGNMKKGCVREGEGKEFGIDGKSALYVGEWKNGLREGYGSEFKGCFPVYIGEWKNGKRHGRGEELNENEEVVRRGRWIKGEYAAPVKRFEDRYGNDLSVFDVDCLKGVERLMIRGDCFKKVNRFVIDGLNELKSVTIGEKSFYLDKNKRIGSECVIMNCDQLNEIHFGNRSFLWYESFELKNLPSLISIQLDQYAFKNCHVIVFDNLIRLQSITLGSGALYGDGDSVESNELIMKNLPSLTSLIGYGLNFKYIGKVILENIPSLTQQGIQLGDGWKKPFRNVKELISSSTVA